MKLVVLIHLIFAFTLAGEDQKVNTDNEVILEGRTEYQYFESLDSGVLIKSIFNPKFVTKNGEACWVPDECEMINYPVSDDGYCHTILDTIFYYSVKNEKRALVLFTSYEYTDGERSSYRASKPLLSIAQFEKNIRKNKWRLENLRKNFIFCGYFGDRSNVSVVKLGRDFYCLKISNYSGGAGGGELLVEEFYSLEQFINEFGKEVFSYVAYSAYDSDIEILTELKILEERSNEDDIYFELQTESANNKEFQEYLEDKLEVEGTLKDKSRIERGRFRFDDLLGRYVPIRFETKYKK
jgi:hypothetical protein